MEEPEKEIAEELINEAKYRIINDDEALLAAEEEMERQIEEDNDRRFR